MIKKVLIVIGAVLLLLLFFNFSLVLYGIGQGVGQAKILWNAREVKEIFADPSVPDSTKQRLRYIQKVRRFAIDSLGLNDSNNYTTMFDQQGKELLWVVTGCEPYAFVAKEWDFPVLGKVPYKGFFNLQKAEKELNRLKEAGYDAGIRDVGGWSTLGWFKDPILSNMLQRTDGDLANLIIHELVHATIFVKDSVQFNENLATFIADLGTYQFLESIYGKDSENYKNYVADTEDEHRYAAHILRGAAQLDSLYANLTNMTDDKKLTLKNQLIRNIITQLDTIHFNFPENFSHVRAYQPNNTYFMSFMRYRSEQDDLNVLYEKYADADLVKFVNALKNKHPYL